MFAESGDSRIASSVRLGQAIVVLVSGLDMLHEDRKRWTPQVGG